MSRSASSVHSPGSGTQAFFASPGLSRSAAGMMRGTDRSPRNAEQKLQGGDPAPSAPFVLFWMLSEENRVAELFVFHHSKLSKSPVQWRLQEFYHCHFSRAAALKVERLLTR